MANSKASCGVPLRMTFPPYASVALTFVREAFVFMTTVVGMFSSWAAHAKAWAWLPADTVTTPLDRFASSRFMILLSAPLTLKDPVF